MSDWIEPDPNLRRNDVNTIEDFIAYELALTPPPPPMSAEHNNYTQGFKDGVKMVMMDLERMWVTVDD